MQVKSGEYLHVFTMCYHDQDHVGYDKMYTNVTRNDHKYYPAKLLIIFA